MFELIIKLENINNLYKNNTSSLHLCCMNHSGSCPFGALALITQCWLEEISWFTTSIEGLNFEALHTILLERRAVCTRKGRWSVGLNLLPPSQEPSPFYPWKSHSLSGKKERNDGMKDRPEAVRVCVCVCVRKRVLCPNSSTLT